MTQFNESFYTDDFDQEMLDFLSENHRISRVGWGVEWDVLFYSNVFAIFKTGVLNNNNIPKKYEHLTKQQFKEKIGMKPNTFTKDMLVVGQHVVKIRNGKNFLVLKDKLVGSKTFLPMEYLKDDLLSNSDDSYDVIAVYDINTLFVLESLSYDECFTLIWQRESPEEAQKRIERQEKLEYIQTLEESVKKAQEALEEAKKELEES